MRRQNLVTDAGLEDDVVRFIGRYVASVELLEVLLLLKRRREPWTAERVARELRIDPHSAERRLHDLRSEGFVEEQDESFVYTMVGELDRLVDAVARAYAERRVAVITTIFTQPTDRSDPLRSFADAFRVKERK